MAELLSSSQSDCNHAAALIERLTNENKHAVKETGYYTKNQVTAYLMMGPNWSYWLSIQVWSRSYQVQPFMTSKERDQLKETVN